MSVQTAKSEPVLDVTNWHLIHSDAMLLNEAINRSYTGIWVPISSINCNNCDGGLEARWMPWFTYTLPDRIAPAQGSQVETVQHTEHVLALRCPSCGWTARTDDRLPQTNHC